jgi:hypothetical protein
LAWRSSINNALACLVALNYFAFRTELFSDEYHRNHPGLPDQISYTLPTLTWETFDKDNASQAFVFDIETQIQFISEAKPFFLANLQLESPYQPVRDKSPPALLSGS